MKILLVDDDPEITQLISRRLKEDNYVVEVATDGEFAVALLQISPYSLVLLDLMLPKLSGIDVCRQLRNQGNDTPILMLTGQDHTNDKVNGLDAGADDYLVKPFELDELAARVRALLRRNSEGSAAIISYGPLQFDTSSQSLTFSGKSISLRPKELAILELMLRYPTKFFEPDSILDQLWDLADCPGKATVKSHIRSLRKQLEAAGANNLIETVYGKGYRLSQAFIEEFGCDNGEADGQSLQQSTEDASTVCNQTILDETWEQVQLMSWHRLSRLEQFVLSYQDSMADTSVQTIQPDVWQDDCTAAIAIAHQLKGTLGSFGFQTAALQAKYIEELLTAGCYQRQTEFTLLQDQVQALHNLLQQHMTQLPDADRTVGLPSLETAHVLLTSRDDDWIQSMQRHGQDGPFQLEVCSPLTINDYLLQETPAVIVLELSVAERATDLSLLDTLVSNYGGQVPILALLESPHPDEQLVAIHHGASAIALKTWSITTLLNIIAEYTQTAEAKP